MRVHGDNVAPLDQQFFRHGQLAFLLLRTPGQAVKI
jgi:hypothetical protein